MNFLDSDRRQDKLAVRRSILIVLAIMAIFVALTKIFPDAPTPRLAAPQLTDVAKPSH